MPDDAKLTHSYLVRISEKMKWNGVLKTNQNTFKKRCGLYKLILTVI